MIHYDGRLFRAVSLDTGSDVDDDTIFAYHQRGSRLYGHYSGGAVDWGAIVGTVHADGSLTFLYQHATKTGELRGGRCESRPEILKSGKIRLHERWRWHDGEGGESVVEEV